MLFRSLVTFAFAATALGAATFVDRATNETFVFVCRDEAFSHLCHDFRYPYVCGSDVSAEDREAAEKDFQSKIAALGLNSTTFTGNGTNATDSTTGTEAAAAVNFPVYFNVIMADNSLQGGNIP